MSKENNFETFLNNIEPSKTTKEYISSVQNTLRNYLANHKKYKDIVKETFLTGSYAKHTCVRPSLYDGKPDVDIAVITKYKNTDNSKDVLNELFDVLKEKYDKVTKQSRSIGIELSGIEIDVVPMIYKENSNLLQIGNKIDGTWIDTNPKGHLDWCTQVNKDNNNKFVRIVKIMKWWRKNNCPTTLKYPKGITLEKIIADNLADCNDKYEQIVYNTLIKIKNTFKPYIDINVKPSVYDPGIPTNNLSDGYKFDEYKSFYNKICKHINLLESTNFSNDSWREVLGTEFPKDTSSTRNLIDSIYNGALSIFNVSHKEAPRWDYSYPLTKLDVKVKCLDKYKNIIEYNPDGNSYLHKNIDIDFEVIGGNVFSDSSKIYWQVVNTGEEAKNANCLRGGFESSNLSHFGRHESTSYTGTHWVQAFLVKDNKCIGKSKEILVKIL